MDNSLAATVILYNPDIPVLSNILSYLDYVKRIYVIDNSDIKNTLILELLSSYPKIVYIDNDGNQGIAHALNRGADAAILEGFEWLLTMDQDSSFDSIMLTQYFHCWKNHLHKNHIAVFSPVHTILEDHSLSSPSCDTIQKLHVMTSGNILNLKIFQDLKGFNEALFIDEVDHEYCLRSNLKGYSILEFPNISLRHNLGEPVLIYRHGQTIESSTHSPKRFYYIARNRLYMWKTYHRLFPNLAGIQLINI
ncbi:MAG: glycosyltransferase, partial [Alphaproteobacteria bacterium]|nr:glycosyltransferase [Alphaproteobacteria bacterium]